MIKQALLAGAMLTAATLCSATTLTVGTPNFIDNGTTLSPRFGTLINFDNLTPGNAVASNAYAASGVQSITSNNSADPLLANAISSQSPPIFVATANFMGGLTITFNNPTNIVGIGILESDSATDTLSALGVNGNTVGSFNEVVSTGGATPNNAYYILQDPTQDIKSLEVVSAGQFGVDDVQFAPEPISFVLAGSGLAALALLRRRRSRA
jgi:hypothetical protein